MYDINCKFFCYFLGFFWGDGSVKQTAQINVVYIDGIELRSIFKKCLSFSSRKWIPKNKDGCNRQDQMFFSKFDKPLNKFLKDNGFENKSIDSPSKILKIIPNNLHRYFWRGFYDADGCFYKRKDGKGGKIQISGTYEQDWSDLEKLLYSLNIQDYSIERKKYKSKSSVLVVRYGPSLITLGDYLYSGSCFGLKRKYDKFLEIKNSLPKITSKHKGISLCGRTKKWRAFHKRKYLGYFAEESKAIEALEEYKSNLNLP